MAPSSPTCASTSAPAPPRGEAAEFASSFSPGGAARARPGRPRRSAIDQVDIDGPELAGVHIDPAGVSHWYPTIRWGT
ncbi:hypothetical protein ACMHYB_25560 [Sorangium sp. So ce1128]